MNEKKNHECRKIVDAIDAVAERETQKIRDECLDLKPVRQFKTDRWHQDEGTGLFARNHRNSRYMSTSLSMHCNRCSMQKLLPMAVQGEHPGQKDRWRERGRLSDRPKENPWQTGCSQGRCAKHIRLQR